MDFTIRPYRGGEERYVAQAHRKVYSAEYNWGESFLRYAEQIALDFPAREKSDKEELWVAEAQGQLRGCLMLCQTDEPGTGQLRLFLVEKECRGRGVGKALTNALLQRASEVGYKRLILWTASPLTAAIHQYEKLGFEAVEQVRNTEWSLDGELLYEIKMEKVL